MNHLTVFNYESNEVRTVSIDNEPWFVGKDICEAFGDKHYRRSLTKIDDDEKGVTQIDTPGGKQNMTIVNQAGLYSLLFSMEPQKANMEDSLIEERIAKLKQFKRWVTHEVLPSIRKHGMYATQDTIEKLINDPDTMIKTLQALKAEREQRVIAEQLIEEQKPKVLFADSVSVAKTTILVGDLAKLLKQNGVDTGANRLFAWMREHGYLIKRKGTDYNMPTQRSMELKLFEVKETVVSHSDGHTSINKTPKITGKGQLYFINMFLNREELVDESI